MRTSLLLLLVLASGVRADEPPAKPVPIDPKDVKVGPPPELARLRKAVEEAARKGENVDEIRKELEALEKVFIGRAWAPAPEVAGEPVFLAALFNVPEPRQLHAVASSFGAFTLKGPKLDSLKPLPKDLRHVTFDPVGKKHYGLNHSAVFEVDLATGTKAELKLPKNLPELAWAGGIAFDSKRERILVATFGGVGHLYSYVPRTQKWDVICELDNADYSALAYDAKSDLIYAFPLLTATRDTPKVSVRNSRGAVVSTLDLTDPAFPQFDRPGTAVQIAIFDGRFIALTDSKIVAMDLRTGKVETTWERK